MAVIRATRTVLVLFFLLPYLLFVAGVYAVFIPNIAHVLIHVALMGALSTLSLQVLTFIEPELPFAKPPMKGQRSACLFVFGFALFGTAILLQVAARWIYSSAATIAAAFLALAAAGAAIGWLTRARVARQAQSLEFLG
jgi:hypothetical protein